MSYVELIKNRFTVRDFKADLIEEDKLREILEAGRVAPTACNKQPQRIFVVKKPELIEKLREITRSAYNAPVVLLLGGNREEAWKNPYSNMDSTETDVAIVTTQMMLRAEDLGIGSTWVQWADFARIKEELPIPEDVTLYGMLNLGYAAESAAPAPQHSSRKELDETVMEL